jgi:hypothetical protein
MGVSGAPDLWLLIKKCGIAIHIKFIAVKRKVQSRKDRTVEAYIGRLPLELFINIFSYLDFRSLVQCPAVCRIWNFILNNYSSNWPSFVSVVYDHNFISYDLGWHAGFREKFSASKNGPHGQLLDFASREH